MNLLEGAIRLYQRSSVVNTAVRKGVHAHHRLRPDDVQRGPCPLAGRCSAEGLASARLLGASALPAILGRMSLCGQVGGDPADQC